MSWLKKMVNEKAVRSIMQDIEDIKGTKSENTELKEIRNLLLSIDGRLSKIEKVIEKMSR